MGRRNRPGVRGATLAEALVVVTIVGIVGGMATAIYFASLRLYLHSTASYMAQQEADRVFRTLSRTLWPAMQVVAAREDDLTLVLPQTQGGSLVLPLSPGRVVRFFRGNAQGIWDPQGAYLWMDDGSRKALTSSLEALRFDYFPSPVQVRRITVTLTVAVRQGARTERFTASWSVAPRNL